MRCNAKRTVGTLFSLLLILVVVAIMIPQLTLPTSGNSRYFSGEAENYYNELIELGFPKDYAASLTELHLLHPTWSFSPLLITEQTPGYTWSYVIDQECKDPEANIIYSSSTYQDYHHPTNRELYDAGYYQVSRETVEYFMDPRNFLNETDIFQFYSLAGANPQAKSSVEAILAGTFMENQKLENGMTYAEYFIVLGDIFDINPVFLATKVRQEQGVNGTSPLISGACGTKLWEFYKNGTQTNESGNPVNAPLSGHTKEELTALDGLYNYFNVKAMGNGLFEIYYNAMQYAQNGTQNMVSEWNGSGAWNTRWKALYGGANFLASRYIGSYQSTVYLQKFNVDGRASGNFSHQYMASVFGALSESRTLFQSFSTLNALDHDAHFLIPVYSGMPETPVADPSNGAYSLTAQATARYSYQSEMTSPIRVSDKNAPLYLEKEVYTDDLLSLEGAVLHSYTVEGLEFSWDGEEWLPLTDGKIIKKSFRCDFEENTEHILLIRGTASYTSSSKKIYSHFLYAVVYVRVIPRPNVVLKYQVGNVETEKSYLLDTQITLPKSDAPDFAGWYGSDGSFLPSGANVFLTQDITYSAVFLDYQTLSGAALVTTESSPCIRFSAVVRKDALDRIADLPENTVSFSAELFENQSSVLISKAEKTATEAANGKDWARLDLLTAPLSSDQFSNRFSVRFYAKINYTNGESIRLCAQGESALRSAKDIAQAALEDQTVHYSTSMLAVLHYVAATA